MIVSEYQSSYFDHLIALHESNDCPYTGILTPETLPRIGYIAYDGAIVGMGFLRMVEGGYGQIDTLVSNKNLSSITRHEGINLIVQAILEKAKQLNLLGIVSYTQDESVVKRALSMGFVDTKQTVIAKNLSHR